MMSVLVMVGGTVRYFSRGSSKRGYVQTGETEKENYVSMDVREGQDERYQMDEVGVICVWLRVRVYNMYTFVQILIFLKIVYKAGVPKVEYDPYNEEITGLLYQPLLYVFGCIGTLTY